MHNIDLNNVVDTLIDGMDISAELNVIEDELRSSFNTAEPTVPSAHILRGDIAKSDITAEILEAASEASDGIRSLYSAVAEWVDVEFDDHYSGEAAGHVITVLEEYCNKHFMSPTFTEGEMAKAASQGKPPAPSRDKYIADLRSGLSEHGFTVKNKAKKGSGKADFVLLRKEKKERSELEKLKITLEAALKISAKITEGDEVQERDKLLAAFMKAAAAGDTKL
jgi:hypothetical protein